MERQFDVIVIGSGSAGSNVARACRTAGWSVAIIDSRPFGGTCALRGCDPKRVLIGGAELIDWHRRFRAKSIVSGDLRIDWRALMDFKRSFTDSVPESRERSLREAGIAVVHGRARFVDARTLRVDRDLFVGRFIVIAGGARHRALAIRGEHLLTTSTEFLELPELPAQIVFVGGGYISFELAHLAARCGARVTIVHSGPRPLAGFDADIVDRLVQFSREIGIEIVLNAPVIGIERTAAGRLAVHANPEDETLALEADLAVHGAGRVAEIDDLELEQGGVARTRKGIQVNEYLQSTTNENVYAAGDAADAGGLPLTPVAGIEGETVAENLLHGNRRKVDFSGLASIVFTIPPLSSVGPTEVEAKRKGLAFEILASETTDWFSSRRLAIGHSSFKVLVEKGSDSVLGASILGPHAEEIANILAVAIRMDIPAPELRNVLFAYPTGASDIESMV